MTTIASAVTDAPFDALFAGWRRATETMSAPTKTTLTEALPLHSEEHRNVWTDGANSGMETGLDLAIRALQNLRDELGIKPQGEATEPPFIVAETARLSVGRLGDAAILPFVASEIQEALRLIPGCETMCVRFFQIQDESKGPGGSEIYFRIASGRAPENIFAVPPTVFTQRAQEQRNTESA